MSQLLKLLSALGFSLFLATSGLADPITPQEALQHIGDTESVAGVVSQVSTSKGGTTFINFGGRYPNHIFYAVIFKRYADEFPGVHALEGKSVEITGTIELYKGKPQIILTSPSQISIH